MNIENFIVSQYKELMMFCQTNAEYSDLYKSIRHEMLRETLTTLHHQFVALFRLMNERLPTGEGGAHFWADPSRDLIKCIDIALGLHRGLKESNYAFEIDEYYYLLFQQCRTFLSASGGSLLPANMEKVELYYTIPLFRAVDSITVPQKDQDISYELKFIGEGSYANVFRYKDTFYNRFFVLKRAKKGLNDKELARFRREFTVMSEMSSPYILEVYNYNESRNEYVMECMDSTLETYIERNNSKLSIQQRKAICLQILRAFGYIHSKNHLHRDVSPRNVLVRVYDDTVVVKISDFGLVKLQNSTFTSMNTEFKGYFNDPALVVEGFESYSILHETYALTRIILYVITGKTNISKISNSNLRHFVEKGLNPDKHKRFQTVDEIMAALRSI